MPVMFIGSPAWYYLIDLSECIKLASYVYSWKGAYQIIM